MKKILIVVLIVSLFSCQEQEYELYQENKSVSERILKAKPDSDYKHLGWGIDMTGDYLTLNAIKAPVINVKKFEQDYSSHIISRPDEKYTRSNDFYGENSEEYIKNMGGDISVSFGKWEGKADEVFPATITGNYKNKQSYAKNFTFIGKDELVIAGKVYFVNDDPLVLQNYLDSDFLFFVNNYSAEQVVNKYGTHVLTDFTLGGKLSLLYRSEVVKTTKERTIKAGFGVTVLKKLGISGNYEENTTLVENNKKARIRIETSGGTGGITSSLDLTAHSLPDYKNNVSNWSSSVNFSNGVPVKIEGIIPIYELISDPVKKNNMQKAVENYIKKSKIELLTPLYRFWHAAKSDHFYSTAYSEGFDGWVNEGITAYIYNIQIPGTVPLYEFWDGMGWDHLYTTWGGGIPPTIHEKRWVLSDYITGYVFHNSTSGTVPLYGFWNVKQWDHLLTIERYPVELSYGWTYEGIACHVYPNVID
jgi:hypothetical protein